MSKRAPGWYWVLIAREDLNPEVAQWDGEVWWTVGAELSWNEAQLAHVGKRIEMPEDWT